MSALAVAHIQIGEKELLLSRGFYKRDLTVETFNKTSKDKKFGTLINAFGYLLNPKWGGFSVRRYLDKSESKTYDRLERVYKKALVDRIVKIAESVEDTQMSLYELLLGLGDFVQHMVVDSGEAVVKMKWTFLEAGSLEYSQVARRFRKHNRIPTLSECFLKAGSKAIFDVLLEKQPEMPIDQFNQIYQHQKAYIGN